MKYILALASRSSWLYWGAMQVAKSVLIQKNGEEIESLEILYVGS